ncbi:hypothetical protein T261_04179 [Streptomyces lydicus]|nr:hypothetical protein T261_04179 [Streptomyces lydicus]
MASGSGPVGHTDRIRQPGRSAEWSANRPVEQVSSSQIQ